MSEQIPGVRVVDQRRLKYYENRCKLLEGELSALTERFHKVRTHWESCLVELAKSRNMCLAIEKEPLYTAKEIANYLAGWTTGSFDEVAVLGERVAKNALSQLLDPQDGIEACRVRCLIREGGWDENRS